MTRGVDDQFLRLKAALADRYVVVGEVGSGGMATVYLADDVKHHRKVAVKVLRPDLAAVLGGARFLREIEIAAQLAHPHILPLHDSGEAGGFLYYVMPYVEGESLRDRLAREGALPIGDVLRILRDVADALAYAHQHGVVHRDIKPDNVMLTGRHALVTDFGVAKAVSAAGAGTQLTTVGVSLGTPAYMAPEQVAAQADVDQRADVYASGVLAYEMLTGRLPFVAMSAQAVMAAHVTKRPQSVVELRADTPPALAAAVMRCLEKDPADRFQSAEELLAELEVLLTPGSGITPLGALARAVPTGRRVSVAAIGGVVLLLGGGWLVRDLRHSARVHWAREQAIPQIRAFADSNQWEAAWSLAQQVEQIAPHDSLLAAVWPRISVRGNVRTEPAGARVYRRAYAAADTTWHYLGTTPLDSVRVPVLSVFRGPQGLWYMRFEKDGFLPLEVLATGDVPYALNDGRGPTAGMVRVPGGLMAELNLPGLEQLGGITLDTFWIDAREVTNRQFKAFVDSGGYRRHEWWAEPFVLDGRTVTWEAAMARFTDRTARPGPSTWEAGDFPAGEGEYPVSGVSWYEAAAYAKYAGKSLPTIFHWVRAAGTTAASWIIPRSNFAGHGPAPVGSYRGIGPFGTFDMAGNVREWCQNSGGGNRYILGGGWNDPEYAFNDAYTQPPFDRSPTNGIRLVRYSAGDSTLAITSRTVVRAQRDFSREQPFGNALFQVYRRLYDYDRTPLNIVVEAADSSAESFVWQRISFDAAYGNERVTAYLFLPKRRQPPYQTVVLFPGSGALNLRAFPDGAQRNAGNLEFLLKSGRAVLYPIYKSTYERGDGYENDVGNESRAYRDHVIMWVKDFRRSIDYLGTRPDIDTTRLAYYGTSWGGALGGLIPAVEPRVRAVVLLVAGLEFQRSLPEVEPFNFLPRIRVPVLMLNGRYDHYFPVETSQRPFFRLLGTPPQQKRQVIADGGHFVPRNQVIAETLGWLDRYLGPVR